jgi:hypothetical protein
MLPICDHYPGSDIWAFVDHGETACGVDLPKKAGT